MTEDTGAVGHDLVDRFARALAQIVHDERPELAGRVVTVAELYQDIAPYRRMRNLAGFELHADYEHALLRFLSGAGGHARLDPESAADELGIEAESSDPDLSLYRKFAACDVVLALGGALPPRPAPSHGDADADDVAAARDEPPVASIEETLRALSVEPEPAPGADSAQPVARRHAAPTAAPRCVFCANALPVGRDVRYCPFCGGDQTARACAECGEPLEEDWRYCVACGAPAES
ncbi:MAG TPA: zinc ribbon domain-containing protein [Longimicrobiales bacterium]